MVSWRSSRLKPKRGLGLHSRVSRRLYPLGSVLAAPGLVALESIRLSDDSGSTAFSRSTLQEFKGADSVVLKDVYAHYAHELVSFAYPGALIKPTFEPVSDQTSIDAAFVNFDAQVETTSADLSAKRPYGASQPEQLTEKSPLIADAEPNCDDVLVEEEQPDSFDCQLDAEAQSLLLAGLASVQPTAFVGTSSIYEPSVASSLSLLNQDTETPVTLSGAVIDGYVKYMKVFVDLDGDLSWDANEAFTYTDDNGAYELTAFVDGNYSLVAEATENTVDISTGAKVDFMVAEAGLSYITPISTVVKFAKDAGYTKILDDLGIDEADLEIDPVAAGRDDLLKTGASILTAAKVASSALVSASGSSLQASDAAKLFFEEFAEIAKTDSSIISTFKADSPDDVSAIIDSALQSMGARSSFDVSSFSGEVAAAVGTVISRIKLSSLEAAIDAARVGQDSLVNDVQTEFSKSGSAFVNFADDFENRLEQEIEYKKFVFELSQVSQQLRQDEILVTVDKVGSINPFAEDDRAAVSIKSGTFNPIGYTEAELTDLGITYRILSNGELSISLDPTESKLPYGEFRFGYEYQDDGSDSVSQGLLSLVLTKPVSISEKTSSLVVSESTDQDSPSTRILVKDLIEIPVESMGAGVSLQLFDFPDGSKISANGELLEISPLTGISLSPREGFSQSYFDSLEVQLPGDYSGNFSPRFLISSRFGGASDSAVTGDDDISVVVVPRPDGIRIDNIQREQILNELNEGLDLFAGRFHILGAELPSDGILANSLEDLGQVFLNEIDGTEYFQVLLGLPNERVDFQFTDADDLGWSDVTESIRSLGEFDVTSSWLLSDLSFSSLVDVFSQLQLKARGSDETGKVSIQIAFLSAESELSAAENLEFSYQQLEVYPVEIDITSLSFKDGGLDLTKQSDEFNAVSQMITINPLSLINWPKQLSFYDLNSSETIQLSIEIPAEYGLSIESSSLALPSNDGYDWQKTDSVSGRDRYTTTSKITLADVKKWIDLELPDDYFGFNIRTEGLALGPSGVDIEVFGEEIVPDGEAPIRAFEGDGAKVVINFTAPPDIDVDLQLDESFRLLQASSFGSDEGWESLFDEFVLPPNAEEISVRVRIESNLSNTSLNELPVEFRLDGSLLALNSTDSFVIDLTSTSELKKIEFRGKPGAGGDSSTDEFDLSIIIEGASSGWDFQTLNSFDLNGYVSSRVDGLIIPQQWTILSELEVNEGASFSLLDLLAAHSMTEGKLSLLDVDGSESIRLIIDLPHFVEPLAPTLVAGEGKIRVVAVTENGVAKTRLVIDTKAIDGADIDPGLNDLIPWADELVFDLPEGLSTADILTQVYQPNEFEYSIKLLSRESNGSTDSSLVHQFSGNIEIEPQADGQLTVLTPAPRTLINSDEVQWHKVPFFVKSSDESEELNVELAISNSAYGSYSEEDIKSIDLRIGGDLLDFTRWDSTTNTGYWAIDSKQKSSLMSLEISSNGIDFRAGLTISVEGSIVEPLIFVAGPEVAGELGYSIGSSEKILLFTAQSTASIAYPDSALNQVNLDGDPNNYFIAIANVGGEESLESKLNATNADSLLAEFGTGYRVYPSTNSDMAWSQLFKSDPVTISIAEPIDLPKSLLVFEESTPEQFASFSLEIDAKGSSSWANTDNYSYLLSNVPTGGYLTSVDEVVGANLGLGLWLLRASEILDSGLTGGFKVVTPDEIQVGDIKVTLIASDGLTGVTQVVSNSGHYDSFNAIDPVAVFFDYNDVVVEYGGSLGFELSDTPFIADLAQGIPVSWLSGNYSEGVGSGAAFFLKPDYESASSLNDLVFLNFDELSEFFDPTKFLISAADLDEKGIDLWFDSNNFGVIDIDAGEIVSATDALGDTFNIDLSSEPVESPSIGSLDVPVAPIVETWIYSDNPNVAGISEILLPTQPEFTGFNKVQITDANSQELVAVSGNEDEPILLNASYTLPNDTLGIDEDAYTTINLLGFFKVFGVPANAVVDSGVYVETESGQGYWLYQGEIDDSSLSGQLVIRFIEEHYITGDNSPLQVQVQPLISVSALPPPDASYEGIFEAITGQSSEIDIAVVPVADAPGLMVQNRFSAIEAGQELKLSDLGITADSPDARESVEVIVKVITSEATHDSFAKSLNATDWTVVDDGSGYQTVVTADSINSLSLLVPADLRESFDLEITAVSRQGDSFSELASENVQTIAVPVVAKVDGVDKLHSQIEVVGYSAFEGGIYKFDEAKLNESTQSIQIKTDIKLLDAVEEAVYLLNVRLIDGQSTDSIISLGGKAALLDEVSGNLVFELSADEYAEGEPLALETALDFSGNLEIAVTSYTMESDGRQSALSDLGTLKINILPDIDTPVVKLKQGDQSVDYLTFFEGDDDRNAFELFVTSSDSDESFVVTSELFKQDKFEFDDENGTWTYSGALPDDKFSMQSGNLIVEGREHTSVESLDIGFEYRVIPGVDTPTLETASQTRIQISEGQNEISLAGLLPERQAIETDDYLKYSLANLNLPLSLSNRPQLSSSQLTSTYSLQANTLASLLIVGFADAQELLSRGELKFDWLATHTEAVTGDVSESEAKTFYFTPELVPEFIYALDGSVFVTAETDLLELQIKGGIAGEALIVSSDMDADFDYEVGSNALLEIQIQPEVATSFPKNSQISIDILTFEDSGYGSQGAISNTFNLVSLPNPWNWFTVSNGVLQANTSAGQQAFGNGYFGDRSNLSSNDYVFISPLTGQYALNLDAPLDIGDMGSTIHGTAGNDFIYANGKTSQVLFGGLGDNFVVGGTADDLILVGSGSDLIYGDKGNDIVQITSEIDAQNNEFLAVERMIDQALGENQALSDRINAIHAEHGMDRVQMKGLFSDFSRSSTGDNDTLLFSGVEADTLGFEVIESQIWGGDSDLIYAFAQSLYESPMGSEDSDYLSMLLMPEFSLNDLDELDAESLGIGVVA